MEELVGDLIVRAVPVIFPAFMLVALLVHWGILPDGTEGKSKKEPKGGEDKEKPEAKSKDKGGEE